MRQVILNDILKSKPYPEAGTDFCAILREAVQNADTLQIDMTGVDSIPTMFMTTSFGCIMHDLCEEKLKKAMIFKNITKVQIERIKKYINDYVEVYNIKM